MINLELYKIFKIVAEEKNITNASKRLNISQPAVTKHIHNLEERLNVRLFERTNKGIALTEIGKQIFEEIKRPVTSLENIYKNYSGNKDINLGIHSTMLNKMFSKHLSNFYIENENVKVNVSNNNLKEMLEKLETQKLDIVISKKIDDFKSNKIEFIKLGSMNDILVINKKSKLLGKRIGIEDLKTLNLYMPRKSSVTTINFFNSINSSEHDFKKIKNITYTTMLEIIKNANSTNAIGLMTKEYIKKELKDKEIVELKTAFKIKPIEFGIYINKDNVFKVLKDLIKVIKA